MDRYIGKWLDNRYELLEVIGTGGMAIVYKAMCHRLNRYVAVKILKEEYARDDEFRRRFHDESQAVAMLSHPNIVSVYDVSRFGETEYIVMELIDGITLKEYMKMNGPLPWKEALFFSEQIAKALSHAHNRGIIHRDIKPHNIMLLRDGTIKVADFGIARLMMQKQASLTQEALGSVHYVSPEQAKGGRIDSRSDIYSLGVVMYEMLTGKLPFEGDTPISVAIQHINAIPLYPREIDDSIPESMEAITMKAMNPSLSKRYASADELFEDLEKVKSNPNIAFDYNFKDNRQSSGEENEETLKLNSAAILRETSSDRQKASAKDKKEAQRFDGSADANDPDESAKDSRKRTRMAPSIIIAAFIVLIFFGGAMFLIWSLINPAGNAPPSTLKAPDLVGKLYSEVITDEEYQDYNIVEGERQYSEKMAAGVIISQDPKAGDQLLNKNTKITVVISRGSQATNMIDVVGKEYRQAEIELAKANIYYRETYEKSNDTPEGFIIRTDPAAGVLISPDETVVLVISQGKDAKQVVVPSVVGKTEEEARAAIEKAGLIVGIVTPVPSAKPGGQVLVQSIAADTKVDEKTSIDLQISLENEETEPVETGTPPSSETKTPEEETKPVIKTANITINIPATADDVKVTVKLNSVTVHEQTYPGNKGSITVKLTGSGSGFVSVFFNNVLKYEQVVYFQ